MAQEQKSYAERAASVRRLAKISRVLGAVFFALAPVAMVFAVVAATQGEWPRALIIFASSVTLVVSGFSTRDSAKGLAETARTWDRLTRF